MSDPVRRFTVNCLFCGAKNHKRSPQQRTFKCQSCGEVNFGPGMRRALVKAIEITTPLGRRASSKPDDAIPAAVPVAGQTTVIKAAKSIPPSSAKPAPKTSPAPAAKTPPPAATKKTGGIRSLIYG